MARWWREIVSLAFLILIPGARSLPGQYLQPGEAVDDPETITGVWEMPVVDGAVGLTIKLNVTGSTVAPAKSLILTALVCS